MCGIVGIINNKEHNAEDLIEKMNTSISHRGPDDKGVWHDNDDGIHFGHSRLSILDLSSTGAQPMEDSTGRYVCIMNGEIYNFQNLKQEIEKQYHFINWQGYSDTEVIIELIRFVGFESAIKKAIGMFAICLWDKKNKILYLARDRMGEKPLYYGWFNDSFTFSSEIKAFFNIPYFNKEIDSNALAHFFQRNFIPAPYTIFKNVYKLKPGYLMALSSPFTQKNITLTQYWSLESHNQNMDNTKSIKDNVLLLEDLLLSSIRMQMTSDVPIGAFLSGGIDSSLIGAMMQKIAMEPIRTFTIGFEEPEYDESKYASEIATYLKTEHTTLLVKPQEALDVISHLPKIYCEPFSDSSQIPTYLLSALTQKYVKVALSGDGGDELFGGYNRYQWTKKYWQIINKIPQIAKESILNIINRYYDSQSNDVSDSEIIFSENIKNKLIKPNVIAKIQKYLKMSTPQDIYNNYMIHWDNSNNPVINWETSYSILDDINYKLDSQNYISQMMLIDGLSYLPDDILVKVDRASMSVGLESRAPFLDHNVVEFAYSLPINHRINNNNKIILRKLLQRYIPQTMWKRPKKGFAIPLNHWLKNEMKVWAQKLLNKNNIIDARLLDYEIINKCWNDFINHGKPNQGKIWDILMFQAWYEEYM